MAQKRFPPEVIAQSKRFFVYEGWGFEKISDFFDGSPHSKTLSNWSEDPDPDGKTWHQLREEYIESIIHSVTPEQIQQKYFERIYTILNDPNFSTKDSDSLAKLQKNFSQITDPTRHLPVMYSVLTQLVEFIRKYYPDQINKDFLKAVTEFKNLKRETFLDGK